MLKDEVYKLREGWKGRSLGDKVSRINGLKEVRRKDEAEKEYDSRKRFVGHR